MMNYENEILAELNRQYPNQTDFKPIEVATVSKELGYSKNAGYKFCVSQPRVGRGLYRLNATVVPFEKKEVPTMTSAVA